MLMISDSRTSVHSGSVIDRFSDSLLGGATVTIPQPPKGGLTAVELNQQISKHSSMIAHRYHKEKILRHELDDERKFLVPLMDFDPTPLGEKQS